MGVDQVIAVLRRHRKVARDGGKSGLQRTGCQVTPGGREPTESAAENKPPQYEVRVKRCGKSAPRIW